MASDTTIPICCQRDEGKGQASLHNVAEEFSNQSQKLSHRVATETDPAPQAVEAKFITPRDPVIVSSDGSRIPGVTLNEAHKLNVLGKEVIYEREKLQCAADAGQDITTIRGPQKAPDQGKVVRLTNDQGQPDDGAPTGDLQQQQQQSGDASLPRSMPSSHTHPLFPPLPLYGPPSLLRDLQCLTFRISSFILGAHFLGVIVMGALFTSITPFLGRLWKWLTLRNPDKERPFYQEENRRRQLRKELAESWRKENRGKQKVSVTDQKKAAPVDGDHFEPTEGGSDPIVCDVAYYARRVGLDAEGFEVQTEDGFIIDLWHVYDPKEYIPLPEFERRARGPDIFTSEVSLGATLAQGGRKHKFPVLLIHGLLQSAGAYCVNDDDSLAFYLCKSGYDVWLGNNRCGFRPKHAVLDYADPRMWAWNIRQMGVFDLPALVSRVRRQTGFDKIGLICHSQGTTEAFVALAKEQRPDLGDKLTVLCALAPAAFAGPLIGKMYFKFMRIITRGMFRLMFGIHSFLPIMMTMHRLLPPGVYGWLGYKVFSFMFNWTDDRWDRGLRDRMFQFAPVYVSAESMRWWLGRECFARHKCILATKEERKAEEREDEAAGLVADGETLPMPTTRMPSTGSIVHQRRPKGSRAWYDEHAPPFALWVAGNDALVDGKRLLRRFERGREPHVRVVHQKVIPEYEHLDVIWAMDAPSQVFSEIREVLWKTCNSRDTCRVPKGCEEVIFLTSEIEKSIGEEDQASSGEDTGNST